jgi:hypothetical protein
VIKSRVKGPWSFSRPWRDSEFFLGRASQNGFGTIRRTVLGYSQASLRDGGEERIYRWGGAVRVAEPKGSAPLTKVRGFHP